MVNPVIVAPLPQRPLKISSHRTDTMVRAIILAAGFGSRLMPLTKDRPKGMVALAGLPLLMRQVSVLRNGGVDEVSLVGGYLSERLAPLGLPLALNPQYDSTNMVESLMSARHLFDGKADIIMAYGDIVYEACVLETLLHTKGEIVVTADRKWQALWSARMEDYASDVETFRLHHDGSVTELGRRPQSLDEVEAQYIGLVKFPAACHARLMAFYDSLDRNAVFDGQPFPKMYMTSFIQQLIDAGWNVQPALIDGGWLEVDTLEDLHNYETLTEEGKLDSLCRLAPVPSPRKIAARIPAPAAIENNAICDIRAFVASLNKAENLDEVSIRRLDALARKLEIAGTLFRQYSLPDMKPVEAAGHASAEEASALLATFLTAFDLSKDPRHLNTVLKALDGSLRTPRPAFVSELDVCCFCRLT
jgi:choline kinase